MNFKNTINEKWERLGQNSNSKKYEISILFLRFTTVIAILVICLGAAECYIQLHPSMQDGKNIILNYVFKTIAQVGVV